jgi:MYXO-CTERM domain-containing protein
MVPSYGECVLDPGLAGPIEKATKGAASGCTTGVGNGGGVGAALLLGLLLIGIGRRRHA